MGSVGGGEPSLREQQRAFTRERLLQAGAEVFGRKGIAATTVDDIAGAAGAGRATFYLHFRAKADVAAELADRLMVDVEARYVELDEVLATGSRAAMRAWLASALQWVEDNRAVMMAAEPTPPFGGPDSYRAAAVLLDRMPRWTARWPPDRRREAKARIALLTVYFRALAAFQIPIEGDGVELTRDDLIDALTDVWHAGLQAPPLDVST